VMLLQWNSKSLDVYDALQLPRNVILWNLLKMKSMFDQPRDFFPCQRKTTGIRHKPRGVCVRLFTGNKSPTRGTSVIGGVVYKCTTRPTFVLYSKSARPQFPKTTRKPVFPSQKRNRVRKKKSVQTNHKFNVKVLAVANAHVRSGQPLHIVIECLYANQVNVSKLIHETTHSMTESSPTTTTHRSTNINGKYDTINDNSNL